MSLFLNLVGRNASNLIREKLIIGLTPLQKKIAIFAAALFACCCLIYHFSSSIHAFLAERKQGSFLPERSFELREKNERLRKKIEDHWNALKTGEYKRKLSANEHMSLMIDQVYQGNSSAFLEWSQRDPILMPPSIVISIATEKEADFKIEHKKIEHFVMSVSDDHQNWDSENGMKTNLKKAFQLLDKARINEMPVLIHCISGISRSTTILAAYLMWSCGLPYDQVIAFMRIKRSQSAPTPPLKKILNGEYQDMLVKARLLTLSQMTLKPVNEK